MDQRFYRVVVDPSIGDGWFLGEPFDGAGNKVDAQIFTYGRAVEIGAPLVLPISEEGEPLDFLLAAFDMPVVTAAVAEMIESIAGDAVQRIPVVVEPNIRGYEILNATRTADCVDEARSDFLRFTEHDPVRPDF